VSDGRRASAVEEGKKRSAGLGGWQWQGARCWGDMVGGDALASLGCAGTQL
jgi:hypothetical protein